MTTPTPSSPDGNAEMSEYWNGERGRSWVDRADQFDAQLEIYGLKAVAGLGPQPGDRVLDIGCGAGSTTFEVAQAVGRAGHVTGMDISEPMLELARARAGARGFDNVDFVAADAQVAAAPGEPAAGVVSRFGVMFFADPVAAFTNIATMVRPGGRLAFVCWAGLHNNPWLIVPAVAVADLVPLPPQPEPDAPGPFSFADPQRVQSILDASGWDDVAIEEISDPIYLGGRGTVEDAVDFVVNGSAMAGALEEQGPDAVAEAKRLVGEAIGQQHDGTGVRFSALAHLVIAHRAL